MSKYPEHDKIKALGESLSAVQEFIDWLYDDAELSICERWDGGEYWPLMKSREQIMAKFFDIDMQKLDDEKRAMLDQLREDCRYGQ